MTLEKQIETLANLGLAMNDGVTIEDLLYSWDRADYENKPYDTILFMYGTEIERAPWGRFVSDCAWNLDMECIEGPGSYVEIVRNLARISGQAQAVTNISDDVDNEAGKAWVSYEIDGASRKHVAEVNDDWADPNVVMLIMQDLEKAGHKFYAKDNGQASIWYYLTPYQARELSKLSNGGLIVD
jgi:hypothetical protein